MSSPIPIWKVWLSYLKEVQLEHAQSEINHTLELVLRKGRLQLLAKECIYSYDDLYINFAIAFEQLKHEIARTKSVLVLGMGTASVPYILEKKIGINATYDLVELDDAIIEMASTYALPRLKSNCQIFETDAFVFVQQCQTQYDMLVFDIFIDDLVPARFQSIDFISQLKSLLNDQGCLFWNRLYRNKMDQRQTESFYEERIQAVFDRHEIIEVAGNWIIVCRK